MDFSRGLSLTSSHIWTRALFCRGSSPGFNFSSPFKVRRGTPSMLDFCSSNEWLKLLAYKGEYLGKQIINVLSFNWKSVFWRITIKEAASIWPNRNSSNISWQHLSAQSYQEGINVPRCFKHLFQVLHVFFSRVCWGQADTLQEDGCCIVLLSFEDMKRTCLLWLCSNVSTHI